MDPATISLITLLIQIAIKYVPDMADGAALAIKLINKEDALSDEEKEIVNKAAKQAHEALQKACDAQLKRAEELGIV